MLKKHRFLSKLNRGHLYVFLMVVVFIAAIAQACFTTNLP